MRFTIRDVLWLMVVVGLGLSHSVMLRSLREAREEVAMAREHFGFLRIDDPTRIYISRFEPPNASPRYRLHIPPGNRYLLHMADMELPDTGYPDNPKPTKSLSMNSWREGADVVLQWGVTSENGKRRFRASTDKDQLFDYEFPDWIETPGPSEGLSLRPDPQMSFFPSETIRFMSWRNPKTKRGVMLWMEPLPASK